MIGITIKRFKITLMTADGDYGFSCKFDDKVNIIRGNNSSGKSTLVNALIYSLGMEEIIGGKGVKTLPYALKEYVEDINKKKIKISSSYVLLEVSNKLGKIITLKRSIMSDNKDAKLIEIIQGPYLSKHDKSYKVIPTFLHDKGSAQENDFGFFTYFERFMNIKLPIVARSTGGEAKLYLQTIFSALLIEQKRGWTDYIANTPYYAIRDVRIKIVEFILNFDVFKNERLKALALNDQSQAQKEWTEEKYKITLASENNTIITTGIKDIADELFDPKLVQLLKLSNGKEIKIYSFIGDLINKIEAIDKKGMIINEGASEELILTYNNEKNKFDKLVSLYDATEADIRMARTRLKEYESTKKGVEEDLEKNKIALKLKKFGAEQKLEIAIDSCPSCHQYIDDSLLLADTLAQPMSIDENVKYLDSQRNMISNYIRGLDKTISKLEIQSKSLMEDVTESRIMCLSLKKQLRTFDKINESDIKLKLQFENKVSQLTKAEEIIEKSISKLKEISIAYKKAKRDLAAIPAKNISYNDQNKLTNFQKSFVKRADLFGYGSAATKDIELNKDTYFPYLSGIELREVNTDIKTDSSASDFVRLIWAYLISLYSVSNSYDGNHVGLIMFDEPGQHSMGETSMNAMLKDISQQDGLQSIIAASFDESDDVFNKQVDGVPYNLITLGRKLLTPI